MRSERLAVPFSLVRKAFSDPQMRSSKAILQDVLSQEKATLNSRKEGT
jgi:hypothetical protein